MSYFSIEALTEPIVKTEEILKQKYTYNLYNKAMNTSK